MKLSKAQQEVVDKMREGWVLMAPYSLLKNGYEIRINSKLTYIVLLRQNIIEETHIKGNYQISPKYINGIDLVAFNRNGLRRCPSFPGYSVNENGEVFSHRCKSGVPGQKHGSIAVIKESKCARLKLAQHKRGYHMVAVHVNGNNTTIGAHVLIADAFLGPRPDGNIVRHLDDNPINNHPSNLAYGNHKDNAQDRIRNGGYHRGVHHFAAKLTNEQAMEIRLLRGQRWKMKDLANKFQVSISTLDKIIQYKTYTDRIDFEKTDKP